MRSTVQLTGVDLLDIIISAKPGGATRDGQRDLCEAIWDAARSRQHLIGEAPTGTGKALAYLAAAVAWQHQQPASERKAIVVVTATKALQEQLVNDDIPQLAEAVAPHGIDVTARVLKGRSNYLCVARADTAFQEQASGQIAFSVDNAFAAGRAGADLDRIEDWAAVTLTGDRAELTPAVSDAAWSAVSISAAECPGRKRCAYGEECFAERARERARSVDIVVVNAALYAADLLSGGSILIDHDLVVIDEAHTFADIVTDAATATVSARQIRTLAQTARRAGATDETCDQLRRYADAYETALARIDLDDSEGTIITVDETLAEIVAGVRDNAERVAADLEKATDPTHQQTGASASNIAGTAARIADADEGVAVWVSERDSGSRSLVAAPINVSDILTPLWASRTVVAVSATLRSADNFGAFCHDTGLSGRAHTEIVVDSPFDYSRSTLYVAKHLPDPRDPTFAAAAQQLTCELIEAAGGRTLALFTSHRAMRDAAETLRPALARAGITIWCQGDEPRDVLVGRLHDNAAAGGVAVFATQSFWTGVDVPGNGVIQVIIDKLPFARPTDPLSIARRRRVEQHGGNAFGQIDVPRAARLLAQGSGRLIRSIDDAGVVAVMDRRLAVAGYRRQLLATLPAYRRSVNTAAVKEHLGQLAAQAGGLPTAAAV